MLLQGQVLIISDEDMEYIQDNLHKGLSIEKALEEELSLNNLHIDEIEAIKFNPNFFYLSSQLILSLPRLRLKKMKSQKAIS